MSDELMFAGGIATVIFSLAALLIFTGFDLFYRRRLKKKLMEEYGEDLSKKEDIS